MSKGDWADETMKSLEPLILDYAGCGCCCGPTTLKQIMSAAASALRSARDEAIEECAKVAEAAFSQADDWDNVLWNECAEVIELRIRTLKGQQAPQGEKE